MDYRQNADQDELRAEFTAWLDTLIRRAKLDYLRKIHIPVEVVSIEELQEENQPISEDDWIKHVLMRENDFCFEEERLANAYSQLPLLRKQILKLLFVDNLKIKDIAKMLNCSANYVSDQKRKALKSLRKKLTKGGDDSNG